jgi:hypothetical protein
MINKLVRIIIEGEGKRERESLSNCCRWENSGRHGPGGGGGAWSRRRFPGAAVKVGRATRFLSALMWRRNEASAWRRTRSAPVRGGGHAVEVDAEEERAPTGVWWGNDRVRV